MLEARARPLERAIILWGLGAKDQQPLERRASIAEQPVGWVVESVF